MSKIVQKWKKVLTGCNKNTKESLIENDFLQPNQSTDEFHFINHTTNVNEYQNIQKVVPIYNEYDNLMHQPTHPKHFIPSNQKPLKESTNTKKIMRVFAQKSSDKNLIQKDEKNANQNFDYCELYDQNDHHQLAHVKKRKCEIEERNFKLVNLDENNNLFNTDDLFYYEIPETENLIGQNKHNENKRSDSKVNLFTRFDNEDQHTETSSTIKAQNLTSLRELSTFTSQREAFHWYLNLINETITNCIQQDKQLGKQDVTKRLNICQAHLLYAKNFYEMRINNSQKLKLQLANIHPCLIALACLLDSDAVRIIESHNCACDTYIYLFSTRLKFCAWKSKLYIILKKPKRSSIDRLNLIEDLTNCHKLIQDKTNNTSNSS